MDRGIPQLIRLTLLGVSSGALASCGSDESFFGGGSGECKDIIVEPIDVSQWALDSSFFIALQDQLAQADVVWADLDDQQKCEMACLYVSEHFPDLFNEGDTGGDETSWALESCTLTLFVEDDVVASASVSCLGEFTTIDYCVYGRRPLARDVELRPGTHLQDQLDTLAIMEHVSVFAFLELADQLTSLGAPVELVERCRTAADDERRHTALLVGLGASTPNATPQAFGLETSRFAIALHNAVEGCVVETWAALVTGYQSEHAGDPHTRLALAEIARDEAQHAQLAWDLHRWFCEGLTPAEVAQIEAARSAALRGLAGSATTQALAVAADVRQVLGLPEPRQACALARTFAQQLAAAA